MLVATRTYDARVLGVGGDEYRRVVRASVYFWGLVAIASYMTQFELSRFVLASLSPPAPSSCCSAAGRPARSCTAPASRSTAWSHRVLAVGGREEVDALVAELEREPYAGLKVVGACMPPGDAAPRAPRCRWSDRSPAFRRRWPRLGHRHRRRDRLAWADQGGAQAARLGSGGRRGRPGRGARPDRHRRPAGARPARLRPAAALRRAAGVHRPHMGDEGGLRPGPGGAGAARC